MGNADLQLLSSIRLRDWIVKPAGLRRAVAIAGLLGSLHVDAAERVEQCERNRSVSDLMEIVDVGANGGGLSMSPNGRLLAVQTHQVKSDLSGYEVSWIVLPIAGTKMPRRVDGGGDGSAFEFVTTTGSVNGNWRAPEPRWSPNSQWIAYPKKVNGEVQLWRSRYDGTQSEQLTDNKADVEGAVWSDDGDRIFFTTDAPRNVLRDRADSAERDGFLVTSDFSFAMNRHRWPKYELVGGKPLVWVLDLAGKAERRANAREMAEYERLLNVDHITDLASGLSYGIQSGVRSIAKTPGGSRSAWLDYLDPSDGTGKDAPVQLVIGTPSSGQERRCRHAACQGHITNGFEEFGHVLRSRQALWWSTDVEEIYFRKEEETGKTTIYAWSPEIDAIRKPFSTSGNLSDCSVSGDRAFCLFEDVHTPTVVLNIDLRDGTHSPVLNPNPKLSAIQADIEIIQLWNERGDRSHAQLIRPSDSNAKEPHPLIIVGYGGKGFPRGGTGDEYPVRAFVESGFAVLHYSLPPLAVWSKAEIGDFETSLRAEWTEPFYFRRVIMMLLNAVDELAERGIVDPERVGLTGFSKGNNAAVFGLINFPDRFAAAALSGHSWEPAWWYTSGRAFEQLFQPLGFGEPGSENDRLWNRMSFIRNVERLTMPILFNSKEREVGPGVAQMYGALKRGNRPIEMFIYANGGHIVWNPRHRLHIYQRNLDWFRFWLQGHQDACEHKSNQYNRWRQLRERHVAELQESGKAYNLPIPDS